MRYSFFNKSPIVLIIAVLLTFTGIGHAQQNASLSGQVLNGVNSQPLANVEITLASAANRVDTEIAPFAADTVVRLMTTTDANGRYQFSNVPTGDYVIFAQGEDLADLAPITLVLEDGASEVIDLTMTPGGAITGQVTSSNGGAVSTGIVTLFDRALAVQAVSIREDGTYLFEHVIPGREYQIFVQTETEAGLSPTGQQVDEGQALEIDMQTAPAARLTGRVVSDNGTPVENAAVAIEGESLRWSGLTDENGVYTLGGDGADLQTIIPDTYNIRVRADRHVSIFEESIDLTSPTQVTRDFTLQPAGVVSGRVVDQNGSPISNATVSAVGETGSENTTLTQEDGTYTLDLYNPDQVYTLTAFFPEHVSARITDVQAAAGQTTSGVNFTLQQGVLVQGTLTSEGEATRGIVDFYATDGEVYSINADSDGTFQFEGLAVGDYTVVVSTVTEEFAYVGVVAIEEATAQLSLELAQSGSLAGNIGGAGAVVAVFNDIPVAVQVADENGDYVFEAIAPATYSLIVYSTDGASEAQEVTVEAGAETQFDQSGE